MPDAGYLTIGKVVKRLQAQYPDLSVSKVRYLEDEGLLTPSRTPGGYRLYSQHDIRRLETILYLQKNRFLPLQVIREELEKGDAGIPSVTVSVDPQEAGEQEPPSVPRGLINEFEDSEELEKYHPISRMPELLGVSVGFVRELSEAGVVRIRRSPHGRDLVDGHDIPLIRTCEELRRFGIAPKNLRQYVQAANRESGMFESALTVYGANASGGVATPTNDQRQRYDQALLRMISLTNTLRELLIRRNLSNGS